MSNLQEFVNLFNTLGNNDRSDAQVVGSMLGTAADLAGSGLVGLVTTLVGVIVDNLFPTPCRAAPRGCASTHRKIWQWAHRGFEPPATFGATKTPKTRLFNPNQCPAHGRLWHCAPTLSDRMPGIRLSFKGRRVQVRRNDSFRSGVLADGTRKPSPRLGVDGKCIKGRAKCTCVNFGWSVGHPTFTWEISSRANARFRASFEVEESLRCWSP